ncbi:MAG: DUF2306 domain-containing protein [Aeromicrobium sp.]
MTWSLLLATHAFAAAVALPLGVWQLFRPTKGDHQHRLIGRTWVVLMLYVSFTSFWIKELDPGEFSLIHILSVVTIVTVSLGMAAAIRGDVRSHRANMTGSWLGLLGAFIGAVAVPVRHIPTFVLAEPAQALAAFVAVLATTAAVVAAARVLSGALPQRRMAS